MSVHGSVLQHYPPVIFRVKEHIRGRVVTERVVWIGEDEFTCSGLESVSSLLSVVRHVTALHLFLDPGVDSSWTSEELLDVVFTSLQCFTQLRTLDVRVAMLGAAGASLAAGLDALPSLTSLDLDSRAPAGDAELTASLHRLCSSQLHHLTVHPHQLLKLVDHQPQAVMPRLRSLTITLSLYNSFTRSHWLERCPFHQFRSLLHLTIADHEVLRLLATAGAQLSPLSSLTVYALVAGADLTHINTRSFRVLCPEYDRRDNRREQIYQMMRRAPRSVLQLALHDSNAMRTDRDRLQHVFPSADAASFPLCHLTYLEFVVGPTLTDLTYLLTAGSPPTFAAQLTHLALRVHWMERAAAAPLLPSLLSLYPSLTHVHVGVWGKPHNAQIVDCVEWDSAVQAVRSALGSAWCESVDDVVAYREDVLWRRSAGLPSEVEHVLNRVLS